jgi:hypothetical protein
MKKAKFSKKLVLNKETISNLNNESMFLVKGGTDKTFSCPESKNVTCCYSDPKSKDAGCCSNSCPQSKDVTCCP